TNVFGCSGSTRLSAGTEAVSRPYSPPEATWVTERNGWLALTTRVVAEVAAAWAGADAAPAAVAAMARAARAAAARPGGWGIRRGAGGGTARGRRGGSPAGIRGRARSCHRRAGGGGA